MRAAALIGLVGCGFSIPEGTPTTDARPSDGASGDGSLDGPDDVPPPPIDAAPDAPGARSCGPGYVSVPAAGTTSTYKKVNTGAFWTTARDACAADTAYLMIPETLTEGSAVYALVAPQINSPFYWAGVHDNNNDGVWTTVLGQVFASPPWAPTQPSGNSGETVVLVGANGQFYDYYPNAPQEYACECAP